MHTLTASRVFAAAVLAAALGIATGPVLAEERVTGSEIPTNSYYGDPLTPDERAGIASEENVSPNDGRPSMPDAADDGVIPTPEPIVPGDSAAAPPNPAPAKTAESEAEVVLDDAKKNAPVTASEFDKCLSQWDPQTQMSKEQWEGSCRSTLPYFPEGSN